MPNYAISSAAAITGYASGLGSSGSWVPGSCFHIVHPTGGAVKSYLRSDYTASQVKTANSPSYTSSGYHYQAPTGPTVPSGTSKPPKRTRRINRFIAFDDSCVFTITDVSSHFEKTDGTLGTYTGFYEDVYNTGNGTLKAFGSVFDSEGNEWPRYKICLKFTVKLEGKVRRSGSSFNCTKTIDDFITWWPLNIDGVAVQFGSTATGTQPDPYIHSMRNGTNTTFDRASPNFWKQSIAVKGRYFTSNSAIVFTKIDDDEMYVTVNNARMFDPSDLFYHHSTYDINTRGTTKLGKMRLIRKKTVNVGTQNNSDPDSITHYKDPKNTVPVGSSKYSGDTTAKVIRSSEIATAMRTGDYNSITNTFYRYPTGEFSPSLVTGLNTDYSVYFSLPGTGTGGTTKEK